MSFDDKISRFEQQLDQDDALLRKYEDEFRAEAVKFLRRWWWDTTARMVQRSPTLTRKYGHDGISILKSRVNTLRDRAGEIVGQVMDDDRVWWHKTPRAERDKHARYTFRSERIGPKQLDASLRVAMGAIAPLLLEFGYIEERRAVQWQEWDAAGENPLPNARHCYPYAFDWPEPLLETARSYADRVQYATNRMRDIAAIRARQKEESAGAIWDAS